MPFRHAGCPIRKSADQWSFAPTRGLSQLITSFIASVSQGIHLAPLSTSSMCELDGRFNTAGSHAHTFSWSKICFSQIFYSLVFFSLVQYVKDLFTYIINSLRRYEKLSRKRGGQTTFSSDSLRAPRIISSDVPEGLYGRLRTSFSRKEVFLCCILTFACAAV